MLAQNPQTNDKTLTDFTTHKILLASINISASKTVEETQVGKKIPGYFSLRSSKDKN